MVLRFDKFVVAVGVTAAPDSVMGVAVTTQNKGVFVLVAKVD